MYAHIICYDSLPNCRRGGDLSVGASVSIHVGAGIRKQAGWTHVKKDSLILKVVLGYLHVRIHVCTSSCVYVQCMYNVCTHVMTVYLVAVEMKMCLKMLQFQHTVQSQSQNCYM